MASSPRYLQTKGIRQFEAGDFQTAISTFQEAAAGFEAAGDPLSAAEMQVNIGLCYRSLEDYEAAYRSMEAGLAVFREKGDRFREAQGLGNLALVYAKQDNTEQADTYYRDAARLFRDLREDEYYSQTIMALADLQFRAGKLLEAVATFEVAMEYIKTPNQRQKMAKQLMVVKNRLSGQAPASPVPSGPRALRSEAAEDDEE